MSNNFKSKKFILFLFVFYIFFNFINLTTSTITFTLDDTNINDIYEKPTYFHVKPNFNVPNYIKISIEGKNKDINYIISYYQNDLSLQTRNQLSQNNFGKVFMWLNKEQIIKSFYLGIECSNSPCQYSLNITQEKDMILYLGEQYTYYVTKANEKMKFIISGIPKINYEINANDSQKEYKLSIWAKGNKIINTKLDVECHTYLKDNFNGYIIEIDELKENNYTFIVNANEGDLINVGAYFFNGENICQTPIKYFGSEFSIFFQEKIIDFFCFLFSIGDYDLITLLNRIHMHESSVYSNIPYFLKPYDEEYNICCFQMNKYSDYKKYFYSFQYNYHNNPISPIVNILPPLILGANYYISMRKGETIGLIPNKPNNDFKYITYYSKEIEGIYNASILNCNIYPFCKKYSNNITPLIYYNSTTITYNNNEYDNNINPISYNQKVLLLTCKTQICLLNAYIYTDKNNITLVPEASFYKYIEKNIEEKLVFCMRPYIPVNQRHIHWYLNLEILNGDIEISFMGAEFYEYKNKNKILYEISADKTREFLLKIKANKNSIYSISTIFEKIVDNEDLFLLPQANYLLKFNTESKENTVIINDETRELYYINFFSLNCKIEVKKMLNFSVDIKNRNDIYQDFVNIFEEENIFNGYKIRQINGLKTDVCLYGLSLFRFKNNNNDLNSIILAKKISKSFIFNKEHNKVKFMYLHTEKELDVNIKFNLYDDIVFNVTIYFNDLFYNMYYIKKNNIISIESFQIKQRCIDDKQLCKINLIISPEKYNNNTILKIIFNTEEKQKYNDDNFVYIIIIISISLIILLGLLSFLYMYLKKNEVFYHRLLSLIIRITTKENKKYCTENNGKKDYLI